MIRLDPDNLVESNFNILGRIGFPFFSVCSDSYLDIDTIRYWYFWRFGSRFDQSDTGSATYCEESLFFAVDFPPCGHNLLKDRVLIKIKNRSYLFTVFFFVANLFTEIIWSLFLLLGHVIWWGEHLLDHVVLHHVGHRAASQHHQSLQPHKVAECQTLSSNLIGRLQDIKITVFV